MLLLGSHYKHGPHFLDSPELRNRTYLGQILIDGWPSRCHALAMLLGGGAGETLGDKRQHKLVHTHTRTHSSTHTCLSREKPGRSRRRLRIVCWAIWKLRHGANDWQPDTGNCLYDVNSPLAPPTLRPFPLILRPVRHTVVSSCVNSDGSVVMELRSIWIRIRFRSRGSQVHPDIGRASNCNLAWAMKFVFDSIESLHTIFFQSTEVKCNNNLKHMF